MTRKTRVSLLVILVTTLAALAGFYFDRPRTVTPPPAEGVPTADAAARLLALTLPDMEGRPQALKQWQGKILVVNFWATWCPPCKEEMPEFSRINAEQASNNVQFVGISIDSAEKVIDFQKTVQVGYPLLIAPLDTLDLSFDLGNQAKALPFTVILRPNGSIQQTKLGKYAAADLESALEAAQQPD